MGKYLMLKLAELKNKYPAIKEIRGIGLMVGVQLDSPGKDIVSKCMEKGLLINCTHDTVLRLMPALNVKRKEIDRAIEIIDASFQILTGG